MAESTAQYEMDAARQAAHQVARDLDVKAILGETVDASTPLVEVNIVDSSAAVPASSEQPAFTEKHDVDVEALIDILDNLDVARSPFQTREIIKQDSVSTYDKMTPTELLAEHQKVQERYRGLIERFQHLRDEASQQFLDLAVLSKTLERVLTSSQKKTDTERDAALQESLKHLHERFAGALSEMDAVLRRYEGGETAPQPQRRPKGGKLELTEQVKARMIPVEDVDSAYQAHAARVGDARIGFTPSGDILQKSIDERLQLKDITEVDRKQLRKQYDYLVSLFAKADNKLDMILNDADLVNGLAKEKIDVVQLAVDIFKHDFLYQNAIPYGIDQGDRGAVMKERQQALREPESLGGELIEKIDQKILGVPEQRTYYETLERIKGEGWVDPDELNYYEAKMRTEAELGLLSQHCVYTALHNRISFLVQNHEIDGPRDETELHKLRRHQLLRGMTMAALETADEATITSLTKEVEGSPESKKAWAKLLDAYLKDCKIVLSGQVSHEGKLVQKPDLDGQMALKLFEVAGYQIKPEQIIYKLPGSHPSGTYDQVKKAWKGYLHIDLGGYHGAAVPSYEVFQGIMCKGVASKDGRVIARQPAFIDHHAPWSPPDTSAALELCEIFDAAGKFDALGKENKDALQRLVGFVTNQDNKDYRRYANVQGKGYQDSYRMLLGQWRNVRDNGTIALDKLWGFFKKKTGKGEGRPREADDFLSKQDIADLGVGSDIKKQEQSIQHAQKRYEELKGKGYVINGRDGKIFINPSEGAKGHLPMQEVAMADGCAVYVAFDEKTGSTFVARNLLKAGDEDIVLPVILPGLKQVRSNMQIRPRFDASPRQFSLGDLIAQLTGKDFKPTGEFAKLVEADERQFQEAKLAKGGDPRTQAFIRDALGAQQARAQQANVLSRHLKTAAEPPPQPPPPTPKPRPKSQPEDEEWLQEPHSPGALEVAQELGAGTVTRETLNTALFKSVDMTAMLERLTGEVERRMQGKQGEAPELAAVMEQAQEAVVVYLDQRLQAVFERSRAVGSISKEDQEKYRREMQAKLKVVLTMSPGSEWYQAERTKQIEFLKRQPSYKKASQELIEANVDTLVLPNAIEDIFAEYAIKIEKKLWGKERARS